MKFKYYLRGLGIGILISTIILSVSFAMKKNDLSDDEIIARAKRTWNGNGRYRKGHHTKSYRNRR